MSYVWKIAVVRMLVILLRVRLLHIQGYSMYLVVSMILHVAWLLFAVNPVSERWNAEAECNV